jgi:hypothetical protein
MSRKETGLRTVSSLRFFTECVNGRHHFFLTGLGITRAIQTLAPEDEKVPEPFRGAWRGAGPSGLSGSSRLSGFSGLFGSTNERDKIDPRIR